MKKLIKIFYIICGVLFLIIGIIAFIIPMLPSTIFILLSSFCFTKGSDKIYKKFKKSKIYRDYIQNFSSNGLTLEQKFKLACIVDLAMLICGLFTKSTHVRVFLFLSALLKTLIIFEIKPFHFRLHMIKNKDKF